MTYLCNDCGHEFGSMEAVNCSLAADEYNVGCPHCHNDWCNEYGHDIAAMGDQRDKILEAQSTLGIGPVELARRLNTPYDTLKEWKSERVVMPGVAWVAIDLLTKPSTAQSPRG